MHVDVLCKQIRIITSCDSEHQIVPTRPCEPRSLQPVGTIWLGCGLGSRVALTDLDRRTRHRFVRGEAVESDDRRAAPDSGHQFEQIRMRFRARGTRAGHW